MSSGGGERGTNAVRDEYDNRQERVHARPEWLGEFSDPPRGARTDDDDLWDDDAPGWRSTVDRVRTTPRAAVALCGVGVIAVIVAAVAVFSGSGAAPAQYPVVNFSSEPDTASAAPSNTAASSSAPSTSAPAPVEFVVAVVGLVRAPGLHRLAPGARVADALTAARGTLPGADTAGLNLAQPLHDGEQVIVGVVDAKAGITLRSAVVAPRGQGAASAGSSAAGSAAPVNINTAGVDELDRLPGVGAATAAAIVAYREQHGPFGSVDDLGKVSGIGDAKLAKIKPLATV